MRLSSYNKIGLNFRGVAGMNAKEVAVDEIIKIYKIRITKSNEVLQALGQVGGLRAIEEILSIYKKRPNKTNEVLQALGQAGKNIT